MKCPHCGKDIKYKKGDFTPEFLEFWNAYDAKKRCPSASKSEAMKAWNQIERPPNILDAVKPYHAYIDKEKIPACHPATWLRQGRYEGFISSKNCTNSSAPIMASSINCNPSWPSDIALALSNEIGEHNFQTWFLNTQYEDLEPFDPNCPVKLTISSSFRRDYIIRNFTTQLAKILGIFIIAVNSSS